MILSTFLECIQHAADNSDLMLLPVLIFIYTEIKRKELYCTPCVRCLIVNVILK